MTTIGRHTEFAPAADMTQMSLAELALTIDALVVEAETGVREWMRANPGRIERLIEAIAALSYADQMLSRLFQRGAQENVVQQRDSSG